MTHKKMSSRKEIPFFILVLLLLLAASKGFGDDHTKWSNRYIRWMKNNNDQLYTLRLCASRDDEQQCGNFTWTFPAIDGDSPCTSKFNCTNLKNSTEERCKDQQFYQVWKNYTCNCSSTVETGTTSTSLTTHNTNCSGATTTGADNNSVQSSVVLATLVGILAVLLTVVTIGWVYTCCMVKNLQGKNEIHRTINSSEFATAMHNYENNTLGNTIRMTRIQPSPAYSRLRTENETIHATGTEKATWVDSLYTALNSSEYHMLDRSKKGPDVMVHQRGEKENYTSLKFD